MVGTTTSNRSWEVWQTLRGMGSPRQILFRLIYGSRLQRSGHIGARTRWQPGTEPAWSHPRTQRCTSLRLCISSRKTVHSKLCRAWEHNSAGNTSWRRSNVRHEHVSTSWKNGEDELVLDVEYRMNPNSESPSSLIIHLPLRWIPPQYHLHPL